VKRAAARLAPVALLAVLGAPAAADEPPPPEGTFCLRAGKVYTGAADGEVLAPGCVLVEDGKVRAVLAGADPELPDGIPLIDRPRLVVVPGLVAAQLAPESGRRADETASARFRAVDGYDPYADHRDYLARGITTAFLHPGRGRLVTGRGAVVKLAGPPGERVVVERADLCVELGEAALDPPPDLEIPVPSSSDVPIEPGEPQRPTSRLGAPAELVARIEAARAYAAARRGPAAERPDYDPDLEALAAGLAGRIRLDARRALELRAAFRLALELGFEPPLLAGATEAADVLDALRAVVPGDGVERVVRPLLVYEVPVPLRGDPRDRGVHPDRLRVRSDAPRRLAEAGLTFALAAPPGSEAELRLLAGLAVRGGLAPARALAAITADAARVLGVAERVGSLAPGRDADLVLLSGDPFARGSQVVETWVGGRRVYRARPSGAVVVRAGTIHTLAGRPIRDGEVLIEDGTIAAVGSAVPHPRGARLVDAGPDGVVTPGFVDAYGHVGLLGDRGRPKLGVPLHGLVGRDRPDLLAVARAGITTVVMTPWRLHPAGSRAVAIKTAEAAAADDLRRGMVLREVAGVAFDFEGADPLVLPRALRGRLKAGEAYVQKWEKYRRELAEWEEAKRKGEAVEAAEEEPEPESAEPKVDPISGTWAITLSGGPLPEPQTGTLKLLLESDGVTIKGQAESPGSPSAAPVSGTLEGKEVSLTLEVESPFGDPQIEAELDAEDHMEGTLSIGARLRLDFEASRTEREAPEITLTFRRSRGEGGRPLPPPVDPDLEPMRAALEGRAVLVLRVDSAAAARTLLEALGDEGLRAVFVGLEEGDLVAAELRAAGAGVVVRPERLREREGREGAVEVVPAAELARAGVAQAFMSEAEDGARELPLRALAAVERGLSAGDALRALTVDAARLYGLDDRVGSLEVGKDGDLLVFDGDPFAATSRLRAVVVGGRILEEVE